MSAMADPAPRQLASFAVPSEPGNERLALARVAAAVDGHGLTGLRLERLKTAVAEAAMNAIEHGNRNQPDVPVDVEVTEAGGDIVVTITDQGGAAPGAGPAEEPDLSRKLAGGQDPRGWGLFLIRSMVDAMDVTTHGTRHTVRLVMRVAGDGDDRAAAARGGGPGADQEEPGPARPGGKGAPHADHL
jgi:anti-sigma regulatory factor (Ser/Thr protein kinase)